MSGSCCGALAAMQGVNGERRFALRSSATAVAAASEENQSITSGPHLRLLPPSASLGHSNPRIPGPFYCLPADITDALVSGRVTSAISRRRDFGWLSSAAGTEDFSSEPGGFGRCFI